MSDNAKKISTDSHSPLWMQQLFEGKTNPSETHKIEIIRNGIIIHEYELEKNGKKWTIGRHPDADIQIEAKDMAMFHVVLKKVKANYVLECLAPDNRLYLNQKPVRNSISEPLRDGFIAELPGVYLKFVLPGFPAPKDLQMSLQTLSNQLLQAQQSDKTRNLRLKRLNTHLLHAIQTRSVCSTGTHELQVTGIINETQDSKTFRLCCDPPQLFSYKPGQYITVIAHINQQEVHRAYSLSSSPSRPFQLEITVKRVPGGLVSNWLCDELRIGNHLTVTGPHGKFSPFEHPSGKLLFIAAGSGITPIMSMLRWLADTGAQVDVKVLISGKQTDEIIFYKELEAIAARNRNIHIQITLTSHTAHQNGWLGLTGRINLSMLQNTVPDYQDREIFICGPDLFMQNVQNLLNNAGFAMEHFHSESFGAPNTDQTPISPKIRTSGQYKITFKQSEITTYSDGKESLLELAQVSGVKIESSCRAGSCGMCMVKCSGEVETNEDCEIDSQNRQAGYIYTCCTQARGNLVLDI
jgi:ferredoxin-NADP reductase